MYCQNEPKLSKVRVICHYREMKDLSKLQINSPALIVKELLFSKTETFHIKKLNCGALGFSFKCGPQSSPGTVSSWCVTETSIN